MTLPRSSTSPQLRFAPLSPLALIAVCAGVQFALGSTLGVWTWLPTIFVFWSLIALAVRSLAGPGAVRRWLQPAQGASGWRLLGVGVGLLSLHGFLSHWRILEDPAIIGLWIAFGLINPWFEEAYWRGLLMDATASWGAPLSIGYSAAWFALSHPLIWGVHATAMRQWPVILALLMVGALWGVVYRRSRSLRWTIAGHMLANLLGMAVPVLLNLYDPAAR
jgi:membrane protease YdiL (CAAX protease family)